MIAGNTRGALHRIITSGDNAFVQIMRSIAGHYLLGVEARPRDRDGRRHRISVKTSRRGVTIFSRRGFLSTTSPENSSPVEAVRRVCRKAGWDLGDVDLLELNEAFAAQAVAVLQELGMDEAKVNVNGGAVALGHAIGSSGARVLTTLLYALRGRNLRRGIATLCLGGGNSVNVLVERT